MSEPEIDIAALVEAGARAMWGDAFVNRIKRRPGKGKAFFAEIERCLTAVLPLVLKRARDDLRWAIDAANGGCGDPECSDPDCRAAIRARSTLTRIEALLKDESRGEG